MTKTTKITLQIALFTALMSWPLIPFLVGQFLTSRVSVAAKSGAIALGLL